jgi:hypothetical protein
VVLQAQRDDGAVAAAGVAALTAAASAALLRQRGARKGKGRKNKAGDLQFARHNIASSNDRQRRAGNHWSRHHACRFTPSEKNGVRLTGRRFRQG